jgi:hypothetical protein
VGLSRERKRKRDPTGECGWPRGSRSCASSSAPRRDRASVTFGLGAEVPPAGSARRHSRYSLSRAETKGMLIFGMCCAPTFGKDRGICGTCQARAASRQALTAPGDQGPTRCPPRVDGGGGHRSSPPDGIKKSRRAPVQTRHRRTASPPTRPRRRRDRWPAGETRCLRGTGGSSHRGRSAVSCASSRWLAASCRARPRSAENAKKARGRGPSLLHRMASGC